MSEPPPTRELTKTFAALWEDTETSPDVFAFLEAHPQATLEEQTEMLLLDQAKRWERGVGLLVEDYLEKCPHLAAEDAVVLALLAGEHRQLQQRGQQWELDSLSQRFPRLSESQLREVLEQRAQQRRGARHEDSEPAAGDETLTYNASTAKGSRAAQGFFADYELLEEIAHGGMGVVYKARQTKLNRVVAIKMILSGQLASEDEVRRFYAEAEAAARLDHPNIVPIYQVGQHEGHHFFSMGFVEGKSLAAKLSEGPLTPREAAELVLKCAQAMAYAHERGVIHRDLKPSNILLDEVGQPQVADFGLAKRVEAGNELTTTGQVLGTPSYMSPEQAAGKVDQVGPLSDVYSLAAMLYALLTGRPPFQSASVVETLKQVVEAEPVPPRRLNDHVPRDLETICLKGMAKEPDRRYASAQELADDLERWLNDEPIKARPIGRIERGWRWVKRNPRVASLTAAVLLLLTAMGVGAAVAVLRVNMAQRRTAEAERDVARTGALAAMTHSLEIGLDADQWDAEHLEAMESMIADLEKLKPDEAADARRRLIERFAAHIKSRINQPKLTTAQVSDSEGLLTLLAARDKQSSESLRVLLAQRLASWQPVFSLQAPFDEWTAVFHPGRVSMQDESLIRKTPGKKSESQVEFTLVKSGSQAQLEATFDASWQKTKIIGLRLNASQNSSYTFVVRPAGKSLAAEIRKNGITLRRVEFSPQDVSKNEKELTLRAERDRTRLVFQINDQRQLEVEDVFPLSAANQGVYALHWPSGVGLRRLVAQHKTAPDNPSPLERGDELYDAGRFAEALTRFQNQAARSGGSAFAHQARYKAGLCLLALNRTPEAVAMFDRLYPEAGDRWAALAGCQLWSLRLREKKYDEADVLFKSLSSKFRFRDLLVLLPHSLRTEILKEYREGYRDFSYQLSHDPKRLERLKRAVEIEAELVDNPRARAITKKHLLRAHRMQGNLNEAIRIAETIVREIPLEAQFLYEYTWLLRLRGADNDLPHAHAKIVELLYERPGVYRKGYVGLLVERARIQAALNHSYLALQNLREYLAWAPTFSEHGQSYYGSAAFLLHGLLREQAGERAAAYEIWRQGAQNVEECARANVPTSHSTLLRFAILGSLSGDLSDSAALWITSRTTGGKDDLLSAIVRELPEDPAERAPLCGGVIRNMWRSRHGMRFMEKFARQSNTLAERYQAPVSLALAEIARQFAFGGGTTPEEAEILWQAASGLQAAFAAGELGKPQMTQLFHTWRGISDDNGWASLSKAVKPELLGPLAYVLAQRCLHMKLPDPARELLETARRNAKPGSALEKLAVRSLALLESDNGLVRVHNAFPKKIEITLRSGDKTQSVEAAAGTQDVKVAAGTHEITFAPPREDGAVSRRTITVRPAQAITLQVRPLWKPAENSPRWPGPIALPAKLPNVSRWQACLKYPSTEIRALAASPDGRVVAAAGRHDPIVRVYDVASGKLVVVLVGHEMEITALAWSPDGRLLASGSRDATIRLWRMPSGRLQAIVPALSGISTMAWRPDGRQLATANWGRVIQIWGTDGALQQELPDHDEIVLHLSWSPDGKWLASSSVTKTLFRRPGQAAPAAQLLGDAPTQFATFSPEGKRLSAIVNNALTLWDSATWKQLHAFPAHPNYVRASAWAPDGNRIAVASDDHRITVWDTQRLANEPLASTVVHSQRCIDWGPKADSFVTGDSKAAIRVWTPDGKVQRQIGSPSRRINQLAWQPRGDLLAVACLDQRVRLVGRTKLQCVVLPIERGYVTGLVWRDEGHLAGSCDDGFVRLWNVADGKLVATSPKHSAPVQEVAQMPSGEFVSVARGAEVVLWRTTDQGLKPLGKPQGWPADVTVSPQGRVALALNHSKIWLWDSPASQSTSWDVGKGKVVAVAWRPSGDQLAVGSGATVTLLNSKGEIVATAQKHRSEVRCLAWSPSGELLASGSSDGMVRVWDRALNQQFVLLGDLGSIRTIAWNSQGTKLAFAGTAPVVKFCNVRTRTIEKTTFLLPEDQLAHFNTAGGPLALSPQADEHLIYVVERPNGEKELMAPSRFNQEARANFSPLQEAKRHRLLPPPRNTGQPAG